MAATGLDWTSPMHMQLLGSIVHFVGELRELSGSAALGEVFSDD